MLAKQNKTKEKKALKIRHDTKIDKPTKEDLFTHYSTSSPVLTKFFITYIRGFAFYI